MPHSKVLIITTAHDSEDGRLVRHKKALQRNNISTEIVALKFRNRIVRFLYGPWLAYLKIRRVKPHCVILPDPELQLILPAVIRNKPSVIADVHEVYELVATWDKDKIINAYIESPKKGFNTQLMGKDLLHWAGTLLDLSKKGLENRDILNKHGKNETLFLNHLQKIIDNKTTNADHMINKFSKTENLSELYDK